MSVRMTDPLIVPSVALLTGSALLARDYLGKRLHGSEDRYMTLYGKSEWSASNMDLTVHCPAEAKADLVAELLSRLEQQLDEGGQTLLREVAEIDGDQLVFVDRPRTQVSDLLSPRRGLYIDLDAPGGVRIVWNHMQTDGVGMWNALRPLFDENPPLIPFRDVPAPPAFLPELLALPSVARRLAWRGRLRREAPSGGPLAKGLVRWPADALRILRDRSGGAFNLVTSALAVSEVLHRHPDKTRINVGLTAYFPFLEGRNKYGVFLCKVERSDLTGVVQQLARQTKHHLLNWGRSSAQSYALNRLPDQAFSKLVDYYRRQVDLLVSSLPVGQAPITLAGIPAVIGCHPWELTLPYYCLLVGTRSELHVSYTSRYEQKADFMGFSDAAERGGAGRRSA